MLNNFSSRQKGFSQIILSGMCFATLGFFGKSAFLLNISAGKLLALRYTLSAFLLGITILLTKPRSFILTRFQLISSLMLGIFGYALFSSLFFMALTGLSASLTVLLLYTYPVLVALLSKYILKDYLGKKETFALGLASIGMLGLVWGEFAISEPKYLLYGFGAAFFYSLYIIFSRKYLNDVPAIPSSFYVQLGAGGILSIINFQDFKRPISIIIQHPFLIIGMAIVCSYLAMTLFLAGLRRISSSETSILSTTEPLFGVLIATIVLKEKLSLMQLSGGVLILLAMITLALSKEKT